MKYLRALLAVVPALAALLSLSVAPAGHGASVSFAWTANSEPDLAGYKLYYGPASRAYTNYVLLGKVETYTMTIEDAVPCYFALTAFNSNNVESALSAELRYPNAPLLGAIANQTIAEDTSLDIPLSISDVDTPLSGLTLSAVSANVSLVPATNISFSGSGSNRVMTIKPVPNGNGTARITVTLSDGVLTTSRSFVLTVTAANDEPSISAVADVVTDEDIPTPLIPFTIFDVETAATKLKMQVTSSNTKLIPVKRIVLRGTGSNRTVQLRPAKNQYGSAIITLTVTDANGLSRRSGFSFTVRPVNDVPTITQLKNRVLAEDKKIKIPFSVSDVETPAASLQVTATSSNPDVLPQEGLVLGITTTNRNLTISPVPNVHGSSVITVTVTDGEATNSTSFTLSYSSVNDKPVVSKPPDITVNMFNPVPPIPFTIWDVETPADDLTITLTSTNKALLPTTNMFLSGSGTNRVLTLLPQPNRFGRSRIGIRVSDGTTNTTVYFLFTCTRSNNAPQLTVPASLAGDAGMPISIQGISVADLDAGINGVTLSISTSNGVLTVDTTVAGGVTAEQVSGNNSEVLSITAPLTAINATLTSASGLTYTSRSDFSGVDTLLVSVSDNGYSGLGGALRDDKTVPIQVAGGGIQLAGSSALSTWRAAYFTSADLQNPAKESTVWGDLADPDSDGRPNLMEFALGLNPLGSEPQDSTFLTQIVGEPGNQYLALTFNARVDEPLVQCIVEVSPDNTAWSTTAQRIESSALNSQFERVTYQDSIPATPEAARFIRVRVVGNVEIPSESFVGSVLAIHGIAGTGERMSYFSLRAVRPALYAGRVTSVGAASITDSGANWTSALFADRGALYAEFDTGLEADIQQVDVSSKTLLFAGPLPASINAGAAYRIRQHHTVAEIFGPANQAGLLSGDAEAEAESVLHLIPEVQQTNSYFYLNGAGWVKADYTPAAHTVLYPEQGLMVRRRTSGDLMLAYCGPVKQPASLIPVLPGFNLLGLHNRATAAYLHHLNLPASGFAAGQNVDSGDNILTFNADGSSTTFYLNGATQAWYDSSNQPASNVTLTPGAAFMIYRRPPAAAFDWALPAR